MSSARHLQQQQEEQQQQASSAAQGVAQGRAPGPAWEGLSLAEHQELAERLGRSPGHTPQEADLWLSLFSRVEHSSTLLQIVEFQLRGFEFRLQCVQRIAMELVERLTRQHAERQVAMAACAGDAFALAESDDPHLVMRLKATEERVRDLLQTIHNEHSQKLLRMQQATYNLQSRMGTLGALAPQLDLEQYRAAQGFQEQL